jgi:predicted RNA methylase
MARKLTEQRARQVAKDLLTFRGWNIDTLYKSGQCLEENEYKNYEHLQVIFKGKSKTKKKGDGYPDFLLVNSSLGQKPILIVETKKSASQIKEAIADAIHYGEACIEQGHDVITVGVAGGEKEVCAVSVKRKIKNKWIELTLNGEPIDWIPSPVQTEKILASKKLTEVHPEKPSASVLAQQANRLNEILRECKIKDEYRPTYIATFMLALWLGDVSVNKDVVLTQINGNSKQALSNAGKPHLQNSLSVDAENSILAERAWEIVDILTKLNIHSFIQEHDYLGQLYETFFRFTGGNTIGQYFTPRHVIAFMCEILNIAPSDKVFDPACGTGGFLIGALNVMVKKSKRPYDEAIQIIKDNLFGIESEPSTAALCITNMILRGDGKSGVIKDNCFVNLKYPNEEVDFVLMNPPFPHKKKTDTPTTDFLDRALSSIKKRGILAAIVPYSLLVNTSLWHQNILKNNTLYFVATLPADVFQPYATYNTAILMIQKGLPHNNKKVFMARIFNDGHKLKKNNRVEREGNQIPTILEAFESKKAIPELTAFPIIDKDSEEWAPENYIANAKHSDFEFVQGFEISVRKQASFYIACGNKILGDKISIIKSLKLNSALFTDNTQVSLDGIKLGEIDISEYFNVKLGGKEEIEDLEDGNFPIVTTSEFMNGVTNWKASSNIYNAPAITVATDGSVCSSFVQEFPFYAFYKVAILTPKKEFKIPTDAFYYLAYLLSRERWRYVYARKFGKARIKKTILIAPIISKGVPDFEKMAELTHQTSAFSIIKFFRDNLHNKL